MGAVLNQENFAKIFKAYDIRGLVGEELTPALVHDVGRALADFLPVAGAVAVGYDMRSDSQVLAQALRAGLTTQGGDVLDLGQVTSDMVYFAVGKLHLAGGAVVTASHNPGKDNGLKLYRDGVRAVGLASGLDQIRDAVLAGRFQPPAESPGKITTHDMTDAWVDHCLSFVTSPLKPFHLAIDAGNGMAGAILPHILPKLPIQVEEMYFEPDGTFPNHEANPQKIENLHDLIQTVHHKKLDFGIAFDGDGDRAVFVDNLGRVVLGSDLMTIMARHYLNRYPGATIIHDLRISHSTLALIERWGGQPVRTRVGRVFIGAKMRELRAPFGGELSGHFFFQENYDADSGLIAALVAMVALSESGQRLSDLVDGYQLFVMSPEINLPVDNIPAVLDQLRHKFAGAKQDELDGLTVTFPDKWFNIRPSNTEPLMRLTAEAKDQASLDALIGSVQEVIKH